MFNVMGERFNNEMFKLMDVQICVYKVVYWIIISL